MKMIPIKYSTVGEKHMKIDMKDTLRALRQKEKITQKTLAAYLGITPQSVGKWERGEGFPDISLLPRIACFFGVSIDELLGVEQKRITETIEKYRERGHACLQNGDTEGNLKIWETAYAEFPRDCRVMSGLMQALNAGESYPCPRERAERIIQLGELLLQKSTDCTQRQSALQSLCYAYETIDKTKALYYADLCGDFYAAKQGLRTQILDGEEGVIACQSYLQFLIQAAAMTAVASTSKVTVSHEKRIESLQFAIDLLQRLYSDGNVGFYALDLCRYYLWLAVEYAAIVDCEKTLFALSWCCRYALAERNSQDAAYTAPMVDRMKYHRADTVKNYAGNCCDMVLKLLPDKRFDFMRQEKKFQNIKEILRKNVECV